MTIQQHASFDSSAAELNATSKLVKAWESKNAKNAAKAGGISMMALSLAACGGSDSTTTATTTTTTTATTATAVSSSFTTSIDALTGSTTDDTFSGDAATVSGADSVNGGAGSDTLKMFGSAALPNMTSIENLEIHNVSPGDVDLSTTVLTQVTSLTVDGFTVAGQTITTKAGDAVKLSDVTGAGADFNIASAATVTAVTLEVDGSGVSGTAVDFQVAGTGVATINIDSSGTKASFIDIDTVAATTTVDIDATTALTIENIEVAKTIDASGSTAAVTIGGVGATDAAVTLGSGDDSVTLTLSAKDVLVGGEGKDTLILDQSLTVATGSVTGFEVVEMAVADGTAHSIDGDAFAGVTEYTASGTDFGSATSAFVDMASGNTYNINIVDPAAATDDVSIAHKTDGTADSITLNIGSATVAVSMDELTANDAETVAIALGSKDTQTVNDLNLTDATAVTVTGSGNASIGVGGLIDMKADATFDASAATGDLTLQFADDGDQTIKTGSGKDSVTVDGDTIDQNDTIDLGAGADTLIMTDISAAIDQTLEASGVETLTLTDDGTILTAAIALDLRDMTGLTNVNVVGASGTSNFDGAFTFTRVADGTTFSFDDLSDDTGADAYKIEANSGSAAITVNVDAFGDGGNDTLEIDNALAVTLNQLDIAANDEAASNIGDLITNDATSLTVTANNTALTLGDISSTKLTSLVVTGTTDVTVSSGGSTTIKTIDASGLSGANNGAELDIGAALFARAADATITGSDGGDVISMSAAASTHISNVIDAGSNLAATAGSTGVKGDNLVMFGSMSGDTVIDLSSTTDQITSLGGVANSAVQKGFESFDGSNAAMVSTAKFVITGSTGINHITGDSGADVIGAGDGADYITGKGGADVLTGGAGRDTFVIEATPAANGIDTITDFTKGAAGDKMNVLALDTTFATSIKIATLDNAGGTLTSLADSAAAGDIDVLVLLDTAGFATSDAVIDEYAGNATDITDDDGLVVLYFDSATSTVKVAFDASEGGDDVADFTVIAELTNLGSADLAGITADNFVIA